MAYNRPNKSKYNKKSAHYDTPRRGSRVAKPQKQQYRKYYHQQPSQRVVYVEEPDNEGDESEDAEIGEEDLVDEESSSSEDSESDSDSDSDSSSESSSDSSSEEEEEEEVYE